MEKVSTSERLKQIMRERNLKQVDILEMARPYAEKYNVKLNKGELSQFVNGKVEPGQWKLTILGLALDVSEAWLMGYDVPKERNASPQPSNIYPVELKKFPMLGEIACGEPIWADEDRDSYVMADCNIKADFCLKAKGDSMINARINHGDIVFVRQQSIVDNGEIAVVIIDNEATLKRVYFDRTNGKLVLNAENPAYPPMVYTGEELNEIRILGKAIYFTSMII